MTFDQPSRRADQFWLSLQLAGIGFVGVNGVGLALIFPERALYLWIGIVLWGVGSIGGHFLLKRHPVQLDRFLFPIVSLLLGWGILLVTRLAPNFAVRHIIWSLLGMGTILVVALLPTDLRYLRRYPYSLLFFGLGLLLATLLFGSAPSGFGPRLWLKLPLIPIFFQPSELLKLIFVIFMAGYFARYQPISTSGRGDGLLSPSRLLFLGPLLFVWSFCMILLVWQQDLGAASLFFFGFLALLYLATGDWLYLVGGSGLLLVGGTAAYFLYDRVNLRINAWINPWPDATDRAFQIVQSLYALGAGGLFGEGIGQGYPIYIPVVHSDFTLAAIAEEWGLLGTTVIFICFTIIIWRGFKVALLTNQPFSRYLAAGLSVFLALQSLMIIGGVGKLLPLTGVTLPFVSYGGSSMIISSMMVGLLLWLSRESYGPTNGTPAN